MKSLAILAVACAGVVLSANSVAGVRAVADTTTREREAVSRAPGALRGASTAAPYPGPCPVGSWRLSNLVAGPDRPAGLYFTGGGSMTAVLTKAGKWTFSDTGSKPLKAHLEAAGMSYTGTATIRGKIWGAYARRGGTYGFAARGSSGTVRIESPLGSEARPVREVTAALVPTGQATVRCSASRLTIRSDAFTMTWIYTGRGRTTSPPPPPPPPPSATRTTLVVSGSGTRACNGRPARVTGRARRVVLTGSCASVVVASTGSNLDIARTGTLVISGDGNNVRVGRATEIRATGAGNNITWRGPAPRIVDSGTGNVIRRG